MKSQTDEGTDLAEPDLPEQLRLPALLADARDDKVLRQELATAGIDDVEALEYLETERERIYSAARADFDRLTAQRVELEEASAHREEIRAETTRPLLELVGVIAVAASLVTALAAVVTAIVADAPAGDWLRVIVPAVAGAVALTVGTVRIRRTRQQRLLEAGVDFRLATAGLDLATSRLRRALVESGVREVLRELVATREEHAFRTTLSVEDPQGLAEVESLELTIPTAGRERLSRLFDAMPGGSIAIAGARGAGKTTLMRWFCPTGGTVTAERLAVMVPAPVNYGSREYVLHLFGELCSLVLGEERVAWLRDPDPGRRLTTLSMRNARRLQWAGLTIAAFGWALTILGFLGIAPGEVGGLQGVSGQTTLGASAVIVGLVLLYVANMLARRQRESSSWSGPSRLDSPKPADSQFTAAWKRLQERAEEHLREIWFQQSYSTGWSGSLTGVGVTLGADASRELSRHQMSLPDVVRSLRRFVGDVPEGMRVIIGIDELDKMAVDEISQFLKEIKVIFGMRDCFYLLSISEDALSSFERRGLPLRDVFDSSFDESLYVRPFDAGETTTLLQRRLLGMPIPFIMLCHCFAGALPRDTIRVAREVVALNGERPGDRGLGEIARAIVSLDVTAKARAALVAVSRIEPGSATRQLVAWLRELQQEDVTAKAMLARYRASGRGLSEALDPAAGGAARLAYEMTAFCLFSATVLEFFSDDRQPAALRAAYEADGAVRPIDALAAARQAFGVSPETARDAILAFREDQGLEPADAPPAQAAARNGGPGGRMTEMLASVRGPWSSFASQRRERR
jgi:hypothetical protein